MNDIKPFYSDFQCALFMQIMNAIGMPLILLGLYLMKSEISWLVSIHGQTPKWKRASLLIQMEEEDSGVRVAPYFPSSILSWQIESHIYCEGFNGLVGPHAQAGSDAGTIYSNPRWGGHLLILMYISYTVCGIALPSLLGNPVLFDATR